MSPYIGVTFFNMPENQSVESAIHRWVARLERVGIEVRRADITIEPARRGGAAVALRLVLGNGAVRTAETQHADIYVGVADAFRAVKRQVKPLGAPAAVAF